MPDSFNKAAIIPHSDATVQRPDWQRQQADLITDNRSLLKAVGLDDHPLASHLDMDFPLRVPREFVRRMTPGDPQDPLLLQVLNQHQELDSPTGFSRDPLEESRFSPTAGLLHKYQGRALLTVTGHCAIHCRYCFRRHFPYQAHLPRSHRLEQVAQWLDGQPEIEELILSGGDPLSLTDDKLENLWQWILQRPHIKQVRIHSRQPVVLPGRITEQLVQLLTNSEKPVVMVIHSNHANELDDSVAEALAPLRSLVLLNQSVLLRNINDSRHALADLSKRLFECGVLPYYLHLLDPVSGASHFQVDQKTACSLHGELRASLPGYLVPRLALEEPGEAAKTVLLG